MNNQKTTTNATVATQTVNIGTDGDGMMILGRALHNAPVMHSRRPLHVATTRCGVTNTVAIAYDHEVTCEVCLALLEDEKDENREQAAMGTCLTVEDMREVEVLAGVNADDLTHPRRIPEQFDHDPRFNEGGEFHAEASGRSEDAGHSFAPDGALVEIGGVR